MRCCADSSAAARAASQPLISLCASECGPGMLKPSAASPSALPEQAQTRGHNYSVTSSILLTSMLSSKHMFLCGVNAMACKNIHIE